VRAGRGRETVLRPAADEAIDLDRMLRRARTWSAASGRDLVEELHRRRRRDREREAGRR
jgi:hypothetical protein